MIVIVGSRELGAVALDLDRSDAVEMRMHGRRMIVIGPGMNVLKRSYKKCQHKREASL
jgi:hypothetical protein